MTCQANICYICFTVIIFVEKTWRCIKYSIILVKNIFIEIWGLLCLFFLSYGGVMNDVVYQWLDPVVKLPIIFSH